MQLDNHMLFLGCKDLEKTKYFYESVLGLDYMDTEGDTLLFSIGQTSMRISQLLDFAPQMFTVLGWKVDDIESTIDELVDKGVEFIDYPQFEQDERKIWHIGSVKIAYFLDPSGNNLSLTEVS